MDFGNGLEVFAFWVVMSTWKGASGADEAGCRLSLDSDLRTI